LTSYDDVVFGDTGEFFYDSFCPDGLDLAYVYIDHGGDGNSDMEREKDKNRIASGKIPAMVLIFIVSCMLFEK
jgi:hypothetical protein